jgi:hypothetical protein
MRPPHPHPLAPAKKKFVKKDGESEVSFSLLSKFKMRLF